MELGFAEIGAFAIVFLCALAASLALMPLAIWLSHRFGVVSNPGGRRQEQRPMPKLGGFALFVGFSVAVIVAQLLPVPRFDPYEAIRLTGLLLGGLIIFLFGLLDDIFDFDWLPQYIGQIIAAAVAIAFHIFIQGFTNPLTGQPTDPWPHLVTVTLTLLWLGLMMNTVNFLDGLDGLAAGVAFIASLMLFINSAFRVEPAQISVSLLPLALMGASLGFLLYNFNPALVYLGGGAQFLGFALGALSIIGGAKMATILLVMGLPLLDLAWQATNRLMQGRNPLQGDRGHLHFRLLDSGLLTHRQIVLLYYAFCAFFGLLTLFLESQLYKFIAFGVMTLLVLVGFALVARFQPDASRSLG
jgi:UDP-GlcNAc:undecaprenyl-phosphate/decaprenyl-phosphate GlcNAc-1-phosphate transferase